MERSWIYRRIIVYAIVFTCLLLLVAAMFIGGSDTVVMAIVQGAFLTLTTVPGAYLGFAEWSDKNKAKELIAGLGSKPPEVGDGPDVPQT